MAIESTMMPLGTEAPPFRLRDVVSGSEVDSATLRNAPAMLVMFICNHCPYVRHVRAELARIGDEYGSRGAAIVAISSNDVERYPQDGPDGMREEAREAGYPFPYLLDESQEVAHAYGAACTPDFFLFDEAGSLVYRGQLDDSRPGNDRPVTGADLRDALDRVLGGRAPREEQVPSIGCGIKWKPGRQPG
jgi:peroxiredoxin